MAEGLAELVTQAETETGLLSRLPRQLVHGDFWDNNVLFRGGRPVLLADFDFMGERARIDDLALTLHCARCDLDAEGDLVEERARLDDQAAARRHAARVAPELAAARQLMTELVGELWQPAGVPAGTDRCRAGRCGGRLGAGVPAQPGRRRLAARGGGGAAHRPAARPTEAPRWVVLHDLAVPGSRANIDHLVIGPGGCS